LAHVCLSHFALTNPQTPNRFLATADIPQRANRLGQLPEEVMYPHNMRYTLHWLVQPDLITFTIVKNNSDATFKKGSPLPKPSDLLLHYNYGAAAVKLWGHGAQVLQDRPNLPRPAIPTPALMGPTRMKHDRMTTIHKRDVAQGADGAGARNVAAGDGPRESMDSEQPQWDEDDVMLFFWGNSQGAAERYRKKQEDRTHYMEQWRRGVPSSPI